jgi:hypothetical protein
MAFDSDGNLWFGDNAIDGSPFPPQAEELNRIGVADLGVTVPEFGFPTCYADYFTGAMVNPGCTPPVKALIPLGTNYSQGITQIAFAPADFPAPFNHGIFIAFAGNLPGSRNPLIFYNTDTGQYTDFLLPGNGSERQTGLLATADALYVSDFVSGDIIRIGTTAAPEPATWALAALALIGFGVRRFALAKQ